MFYLKSDLKFINYSWTVMSNDDPKVTGKPDSTLLNRREGYEVLPFINRFAAAHGLKQKSSGLKIERLIHNYLPSNIRSHAGIEKWLVDNWEEQAIFFPPLGPRPQCGVKSQLGVMPQPGIRPQLGALPQLGIRPQLGFKP